MVEKTCEICGTVFKVYPCHYSRTKYCGKECFKKGRKEQYSGSGNPSWKGGKIEKFCEVCGKSFKVIPCGVNKIKYCSRKCMGKSQIEKFSGSNNPNWKNGISIHSDGYIMISSLNHPFRDIRGYVLKHRLIMEKHLNRYLTKKEQIHHRGINYPLGSIENKQDNSLENLYLFPDNASHIRFHNLIRYKKIPPGTNPASLK